VEPGGPLPRNYKPFSRVHAHVKSGYKGAGHATGLGQEHGYVSLRELGATPGLTGISIEVDTTSARWRRPKSKSLLVCALELSL